MVTVLRARNTGSEKSTNEKWANAFSAMAGQYFAGQKEKQEKEQQKESLTKAGIDPNLPPEMQKLKMQYDLMGGLEEKKQKNQFDLEEKKYKIKQDEAVAKLKGERKEKVKPFENALDTLNKMRNLGKGNNLGRSLSGGLFGGPMAKDRGMYEQYGKSLIQIISPMVVRNKAEFEVLAEKIYDPSVPDSEREGMLEAAEDIIRKNMSVYMDEEENSPGQSTQAVDEDQALWNQYGKHFK